MEVTLFWAYLVPALLALTFKAGLFMYAYTRRSPTWVTRVYLYLLAAFSLQNLVIISGYPELARGTVPYFEADLFYVATTFAIALIFHLSVAMAFAERTRAWTVVLGVVYATAVGLTLAVLNTSWLIQGYEITHYVITRIPGPAYPLFSLYAIGLLLASISMFIYGARRQSTPQRKLKNQFLLFAMIPMQLSVIAVVTLLSMGIKTINFSILSPILVSYFLGVTAYATHQHRLFDIQFYIPWSKVRQRKTAFYDRITAMVAEIADLKSVKDVVQRLSETLGCPVALVGGPQPSAAISADATGLARFPQDTLYKIDSIVVANEVIDAMPETYALMQRYKVSAIVPFHPQSEAVASWMLLGDSFGEQVYTPLDFKMVEQLFDRLGEHFLDKLLMMRSQLTEAQQEMRALQQRLAGAWHELEEVKKENQQLREKNAHTTPGRFTAVRPDASAPKGVMDAMIEFEKTDKTLDECVAGFEAQIIEETLKRCGGNKSQAARALGLRPNTLHYKIERYRLSERKKEIN